MCNNQFSHNNFLKRWVFPLCLLPAPLERSGSHKGVGLVTGLPSCPAELSVSTIAQRHVRCCAWWTILTSGSVMPSASFRVFCGPLWTAGCFAGDVDVLAMFGLTVHAHGSLSACLRCRPCLSSLFVIPRGQVSKGPCYVYEVFYPVWSYCKWDCYCFSKWFFLRL